MNLLPEKNTIREDLHRDWKTFRSLKGTDRIEFVYDYYKWYILAIVFGIIVLITFASMLYQGQRHCRLRVCVVLNAESDLSAPWFDSFVDDLTSDGKPGYVEVNHDQPFDYDNMYYNVQELEVMTTISSGRMDVAICNADMYSYILALNAAAPLDQFLTDELYQRLASQNLLIQDTAGLQIQSDGTLDTSGAVEGCFGIRMTRTDFAEAYDHSDLPENEIPELYAVIIRNTESVEDCNALIDSITR